MDNIYIKKFGERVKTLRKARKMTQEDLSVPDEISRSTISMIEIGANDITLSKVKLIADALEISVSELLKDL